MTSEQYDKLTDEEKRIKVAELCGWYSIGNEDWVGLLGSRSEYRKIPDYLGDLNACHEFEMLLSQPEYARFCRVLCHDVGGGILPMIPEFCRAVSATAEQRCKAFVLTMEDKDARQQRYS